jgi:hypothetical protein
MSNLLVALVLSVCGTPKYGGTTECHEYLVNCAVLSKGEITKESIQKCLEKYETETEE